MSPSLTAVGLLTAAIALSYVIAAAMYRAEEDGRPEWPSVLVVLGSLPVAIVVHQAASAGGEAAAVLAVVTVVAAASTGALWLAGGIDRSATVEAASVTIVATAVLAFEHGNDDDALAAVLAVASPLVGLGAWLAARAVHQRRQLRRPAVHLDGFRPYPPSPPGTSGGTWRLDRPPPEHPPRTLPPPRP